MEDRVKTLELLLGETIDSLGQLGLILACNGMLYSEPLSQRVGKILDLAKKAKEVLPHD